MNNDNSNGADMLLPEEEAATVTPGIFGILIDSIRRIFAYIKFMLAVLSK